MKHSSKTQSEKLWFLLLLLPVFTGCSDLLTTAPEAGDIMDGAFPGAGVTLNSSFARGDEFFAEVFTVSTGLGPIFNQPSCETCHPGDGRGTPGQSLIRFSRGVDPAEAEGGGQLQDKSIPGAPPEVLPPGVDQSLRMPPPVFGMGILEAIPLEALQALEDPNDADGDGISGRINYVQPAEFVPSHMVGSGPGPVAGRFGRKANVSSLLEQIVNAYHSDIGITSDFLPVENHHPQAGGVATADQVADPEIPAATVLDVLTYLRMLTPPRRGERSAEVLRGETLFESIGCASCHVPQVTSGNSPISAVSYQTFNLYSDLLLHDMGPALADNRPDGGADGYEWKTPPLWGLRLVEQALGGHAFYLHDGRAVDLESAIMLHGGEAQPARDRFDQLPAEDKAALIAMLRSL